MRSLRLCRIRTGRIPQSSSDLLARLHNCHITSTLPSPALQSGLYSQSRNYNSRFGLGESSQDSARERPRHFDDGYDQSSDRPRRSASQRGQRPGSSRAVYSNPGDPNRPRQDVFRRGDYHKHDKFSVNKGPKKYKAGYFKATLFDDPSDNIKPNWETLAAHLRSVLHPASTSYQPVKANPLQVLDASLPFLKSQRQSNLDPFLSDISTILSDHFSTTPPDVKELPAVQKAVGDVLATCFVRAASQSSIRSFRSTSQNRGQSNDVSDAYASYLLHQTLAAVEDRGRLNTMLDTLETAFNRYQVIGSGYRITVSLVAAWVVLRTKLGIDKPPNYQFVWPSATLVIQYLDKFMNGRTDGAGKSTSAEEYVQGIHSLYSLTKLPKLPSTPEALQEHLRILVKTGKEAEILDQWRLFRDQIGQSTPEISPMGTIYHESLRPAVISAFLYAIKAPWFGEKRPVRTEAIETAAEEALRLLPRPYPREILHTLVAHRARVVGSAPEIESGTEIYSLDKSDTVITSKDVALNNLRSSWALAKEPGAKRDLKLYMLYMEGLGRLGDLEGLQAVWNEMVQDEECEQLFRSEEPGGGAAVYPPTRALNQMISATILIPRTGPDVALELFNQAAQDNSTIPIDVISINIVLRHYARTGNVEGMKSLFALADRLNIAPDIVTYTTLVQGFLRAGNLEMANSTLDMMDANGLQPNEWMCTMIIADLAKTGDADNLKLAEAVLDKMRARNFTITVMCWTALISGYFRGSWVEDGWRAVERMEASGEKLNRISYNVILKQAGERLEPGEEAPMTFKIFEKMVKDGVTPNSDTYVITLTPLIKVRAWFEADKVVKMMEMLKYAPEKSTLRELLKLVKFRRRLA